MSEATTQPKTEPKAEDIFEPHVLAQYDPEVVKYVLKTSLVAQAPWRIDEIRADPARFTGPWAKDVTGYERVVDSSFTSKDNARIPVKIYHPDPAVFGDGPYGVHLNFHGGGFVLGDLNTESHLCLSMRDGAGVVVIDVNYRHCPETIWGKCMEDAWAALTWTRDSAATLNIKPDSVSIGGVSAGAHISLVLQHLARDAGVPLRLCLPTVPPSAEGLLYKDYTESPFPSFHEFAHGPILAWSRIKFFGQHAFPGNQHERIRAAWPEWWISPLKADHWHGLCDTFLRTAEVDPLRDEGEAYARKLVEGGNLVTVKRYIGAPHIFMYMEWFERKKEFDRDTIAALKIAHA